METLQELDSVLIDLSDERVLICVDLNAHSRIWFYANENIIRAQVEDFLVAQQLYLLNEKTPLLNFSTVAEKNGLTCLSSKAQTSPTPADRKF
ncbi:hypothetical protein AVEN_160579-1 [Araneus ventricosus]|uniref:Endonuclease/exonuclease/phosphatase domain-containing protein n=1 Tax=Araneus ventricosus TaxID=182803 RepID=A0A4Y2TKC6_ARAVE|nr:hypothetical protein AVEN_160579-1 [Araneus ventricosus]